MTARKDYGPTSMCVRLSSRGARVLQMLPNEQADEWVTSARKTWPDAALFVNGDCKFPATLTSAETEELRQELVMGYRFGRRGARKPGRPRTAQHA